MPDGGVARPFFNGRKILLQASGMRYSRYQPPRHVHSPGRCLQTGSGSLQSAAIGDSTEVGLHPEEIMQAVLQDRLRRLALLPRGRVDLRLTIHPSCGLAVT
jgi:hypothetical protein